MENESQPHGHGMSIYFSNQKNTVVGFKHENGSTPKSHQIGLQVIPLLLQRLQLLLIPPGVRTTSVVNSKKSDLPTSSRSIRMQDAQVQVIPMLHLQSSEIYLLTPINLLVASKKSKPP